MKFVTLCDKCHITSWMQRMGNYIERMLVGGALNWWSDQRIE